eukprot:20754-Chlamydomonas_euryale.AAC.4
MHWPTSVPQLSDVCVCGGARTDKVGKVSERGTKQGSNRDTERSPERGLDWSWKWISDQSVETEQLLSFRAGSKRGT